MKKYLALFLFLSIINPSYGVTLKEALIQAYENNAELNAERESLKASKQDLNIATGNYLPSVTLSGSKSEVDTEKLTNRDGTNASITNANTETKSIKIEQTLIDFGRGADYKKNKIGYELAKVKLLKKNRRYFIKQ